MRLWGAELDAADISGLSDRSAASRREKSQILVVIDGDISNEKTKVKHVFRGRMLVSNSRRSSAGKVGEKKPEDDDGAGLRQAKGGEGVGR